MDEFDQYDFDLRDLLDELIDRSLIAVKAIYYADRLMNHAEATDDDKFEATIAKSVAYGELAEIAFCYQSTIGFHD